MSGGWKTVVVVLFGWAVIAMAVNLSQGTTIQDLQRRIAIIEQKCR